MNETKSQSNESKAFELLHESIQRWIWEQNWNDLRDIQEIAITNIILSEQNLIISAPTAYGKTEAAFLPICSQIVQANPSGLSAMYIGPLKALINDQFDRLELLCDKLEIQVHRWHGDISSSKKQKFLKSPSGILLITPESLESIFVNHGHEVSHLFKGILYIVIDELHSFLGAERGKQLQSLLARLEQSIARNVRKIGLSATIGDFNLAQSYLANNSNDAVTIVESKSNSLPFKLQVRGYIESQLSSPPDTQELEDLELATKREIADHIYKNLRGTDNLIFCNSRRDVECFADILRGSSETKCVPNEFFPHHGNLSKQFREEIEARLKDKAMPTNVVCTSTLEMGIDIGRVASIAQVGVPPSVSSMRQRLGRSGRRGDPAVLRIYIQENILNGSNHFLDLFRPALFQAIAMVYLMDERWNEAPNVRAFHLSTLIQQILSAIAQKGGCKADELWPSLCLRGAFKNVTAELFAEVLSSLYEKDLLIKTSDNLLLLGVKGEKLVNHYSFYTAFQTPEEYRLICDGQTLGTLPISSVIFEGMYLIFAGRRWQIKEVSPSEKVINLIPATGGLPPKFSGSGGLVSKKIRQKMHALYTGSEAPYFLSKVADELFAEGQRNFTRHQFAEKPIFNDGKNTSICLWEGDETIQTLALIFKSNGLKATWSNFLITVENTTASELVAKIENILKAGQPSEMSLVTQVSDKFQEKHDWCLSESLLSKEYAAKNLSVDSAWKALNGLIA